MLFVCFNFFVKMYDFLFYCDSFACDLVSGFNSFWMLLIFPAIINLF